MEKKCKVCGRTLPLSSFPKSGNYWLNSCKECSNKKKNEWRKKKGRTDEMRAKDSLRCALKREQNKAITGKSYRNDEEADDRRAYARKYEAEHKNDPIHKAMHCRCHKNYRQRKKIKEEVEMLSEFFSTDFEI